MPAHRSTGAVRSLALIALLALAAGCSDTAGAPSASAAPTSEASSAQASNSPVSAPSSAVSTHSPRASQGSGDSGITLEPIADYDAVVLTEAFAACDVAADSAEQLLLSCDSEAFGVELTPTTISLVVLDMEAIAPDAIDRFAAALSEAIGIDDGGAGVGAAIQQLASDRKAIPGPASVLDIAPGWVLTVTALADGSTVFTADGSAWAD